MSNAAPPNRHTAANPLPVPPAPPALPSAPAARDAAACARRRARLAAHMRAQAGATHAEGAGGAAAIAIIPTAPARLRNRDADYPYRHDSYFYYLCGFDEPNAWLAIAADGHSTLFCQPKDVQREIWDGLRLGPAAAPAALGVDAAFSIDELDARVPDLLAGRQAVWFPFGVHEGLAARVDGWLAQVRARARQGVGTPAALHDACAALDEMRLVKDAHEAALMRHACRISARAHIRAMQCSAAMLRQGLDVREHHLEAELLHEFRRHGAQAPAYNNIVAAGANACVLHYRAASAPVRAGEMVLIDAGCELHGYASDITRTFPAGGKFGGAQRELYELVLAAQQAAIDAIRPGADFNQPHDACVRTLTDGLLSLGLIDRSRHPGLDDALQQRAYLPFYMHRTSHWLGMDVHDCGSYTEPGAAAATAAAAGEQGRPQPRILRAGMCLTVEPGLYVRPAPDVPEAFWNIGIRIEDDALLTDGGCELLTRDVPVRADDIEALMRG